MTSVTVDTDSLAKTETVTSGQNPVVELSNTGPAVQTATITNVTGETQEVVNAFVTEQERSAAEIQSTLRQVKHKDVSELDGKYGSSTDIEQFCRSKQGTAVWIDADNRCILFRRLLRQQPRSTIYSPYDRMYTVIQNDISFPDCRALGQSGCGLLANKRIVYGVSNDAFDPDNQITCRICCSVGSIARLD